ncbi:hypothetical protein SDC9_147908 [bioreactor metagenome]|uniref:Uncharacterized protein n=1 Tax=bioreactor metagenome TaxID=1076179 RepID=A0A645EHH1_9ZZZZ
MDKYQEYIINQNNISIAFYSDGIGKENLRIVKDELMVTQDEDYHKDDYSIVVRSSLVAKVESFNGNKWVEANKKEKDLYEIRISFITQSQKIRISFTDSFADPYILNVNYVLADKEKFDAKTKAEELETLKKIVNLKVTTGDSLINVVFQPLSNEYDNSKVELYSLTNNEKQLMGKFSVPDGLFFSAIKDLAYGKYAVKLIQYKKDGKTLYESDFVEVSLKRPNPSSDGRGYVVI